MHRNRNRTRGFTLIEIMAVVLIMGMLIGLVGYQVFSRVEQARGTTARAQMKMIEGALEFYRLDNGRFPTTDQGLDALVRKPSIEPVPPRYNPDGYLKEDPLDPWSNPFEYQQPGVQNPRGFDLWSLGADGQDGGEGVDADIGNWSDEEA